MNTIGMAVVGAISVRAFTAASAQTKRPTPAPDVSQVTKAPFFSPDGQAAEPPSRPLFTIGGLEVHLWAPVEAYYDASLNQNQAANNLWAE